MSKLFAPLKIREIEFKNRIFVSPMCQYSSEDGIPTDWHFVHLGSRAVGGAALVMVEATAVTPEGRISPQDSGLWSAKHAAAFQRITRFIREHGSVPGIQLAHAGRKASTVPPWEGDRAVVGPKSWTPLAPSALRFKDEYPIPKEMTIKDIECSIEDFEKAVQFAQDAGFQMIELHFAHGYLVHQFLSPLSNKRTDAYGGNRENRMRFALQIAKAARSRWPQDLPIFTRISATDWAEGGWDLQDSIELSKQLKTIGVDLIDCSSGGSVPDAKIPVGPGYQVPFAEAIRKEAGIKTAAVGMITEPLQAESILEKGQADAILMAREFLRDPYWPRRAAKVLGDKISGPRQYGRA